MNNLNELDSSISNLNIPNESFNNELNMIELNLNRFVNLESIEIGDDCFGSIQRFKIDGLNRLQSLKIGHNSFTQVKLNDFENDSAGSLLKCRNESKSFHILNCKSLKVIEIGCCSFCDFGGEFELRNLDNLESIKIGEIGEGSMSFIWSSFNIRGITMEYMEWWMHRSSEFEIDWIRQQCIFWIIINNNRKYVLIDF